MEIILYSIGATGVVMTKNIVLVCVAGINKSLYLKLRSKTINQNMSPERH